MENKLHNTRGKSHACTNRSIRESKLHSIEQIWIYVCNSLSTMETEGLPKILYLFKYHTHSVYGKKKLNYVLIIVTLLRLNITCSNLCCMNCNVHIH
jgi:hypothetical protein